MKKRFLLLTLIMCLLGGVNFLSLKAQENVVTIGSGENSYNCVPFMTNQVKSSSQTYYLSDDINKSSGAIIDKIAYYICESSSAGDRNIKVYLRNTTESYFPRTGAGKYEMVNMTNEDLVFNDNISTNSTGWVTIDIDDFTYNGNNLLITVFDNTNSKKTGTYFYVTKTLDNSNYRTIRKTGGSSDPTQTGVVTFTADQYSPNIILTFLSGGGEPETPTAPTAPELESPTDGATDVFNQALQFTLGDNTEEYQIILNEVEQGWTTGKSGDVVTFKPQLNYDGTENTWKVVARCSDGNEGYLYGTSEERSFTTRTVTTAPGAVSNVSPANAAIDQFNPTLSWTFGENTEEYQVLFAEASEDLPEIDNEKWVNTQNEAVGSYTPSGLVRGTEYKWKVVTKNHINTTESGIYTFTTLDVPAAVTPNPVDGATGVSKNVTLTWRYADNTTGYRLLFDAGGGFEYKGGSDWKTPGQDGTDSFEITGLAPNTEYSWCVDVMNAAGTRGMYGCNVDGEVFTFTTVDDISPVTEYEVKLNDGSITLEWQYADQKANEYQVCFGETEQDIQIWHNPEWISRKTVAGTTLVEDGSFTISNPGFGNKVYFRVNVRKDEGETVEGETAFCVILKGEFPLEWEDSYNNANDVFVRTDVTIEAETNITAKNVTIEDGGILTINGTLKKSKLTINDGGQLIGAAKLSGTSATFNMAINKPETWSSENKDGWQFISSPFTNSRLDDFTNGIEGDYDLYKYDASAQRWFNYKEALSHGDAAVTFGSGFYSGIGYLASYQTEETATLTGNLNVATSIDFATSLTYNAENEFASIHLLGNPFPFDMNIDKATFTNMVEGFAVVTAAGGYNYAQETIPVGDGFFVKAVGANPSLQYNHNSPSKSRNAEQSKSLNIIATGNAGNDNVVVNFAGEGEGFPKLQNFNDDIATVYVQNNNANYGIYNCDENTTEIELCFNANQMGNYTISMEPNGNFNSIVLVDRFTGIETNMMVEDYHFTAMSEADNNRFMIKMEAGQQTTDNSQFVYQSGEELVVEAEGTVQIIDVMGRMVYSNDVESNSRINVSDFNNGAYIVRLVNGNGVRTQKVVIY